jgi:hypothetical protein
MMTRGETSKEAPVLNAEGQYVPNGPCFVFHGEIGTGNPDLYETGEVQSTVQLRPSNQTGEHNGK